jgi:tetratricopeptide (TPR) repeat protein
MTPVRHAAAITLLCLGLGTPAVGQRAVPLATQVAGLVSDALDLEREERYPEAAEIYRAALKMDPVNVSALLGLERVLKASKQPVTIMPQLQRALARDPRNTVYRAIELRTWVTAGSSDSVAGAAQRWIALAPESPEPYRAWSQALLQSGNLDGAQRVLTQGVGKIGQDQLLPDQAQVAAARGQWLDAARLWHTAMQSVDGFTEGATETLGRTPVGQREAMRTLLLKSRGCSRVCGCWGPGGRRKDARATRRRFSSRSDRRRRGDVLAHRDVGPLWAGGRGRSPVPRMERPDDL